MITSETTSKRLEILRETLPGVRRVGLLLTPASQTEIATLRELETTASKLSMETRVLGIRSVDEVDAVLAKAKQARVQALVVIGSSLLNANRNKVVAAVANVGLPAIYPTIDFSDEGGLMAYSASVTEVFRRSAVFIHKILQGAKPGELPFEQATTFDLVINLKTAKVLGIAIPPSVMVRATKVIE